MPTVIDVEKVGEQYEQVRAEMKEILSTEAFKGVVIGTGGTLLLCAFSGVGLLKAAAVTVVGGLVGGAVAAAMAEDDLMEKAKANLKDIKDGFKEGVEEGVQGHS